MCLFVSPLVCVIPCLWHTPKCLFCESAHVCLLRCGWVSPGCSEQCISRCVGGWAARRSPDGQFSSTPLLCRASPASSSLAPWAPSPSSSFRRAGLFHALLKIQDFLSFFLVSLFENSSPSPPHVCMYVCVQACLAPYLVGNTGCGSVFVSVSQDVFVCHIHRGGKSWEC